MNENDLKKDDMNSLDDMLKEAPSLSFDMPEVKPEVVEIKEEKKNETPEVKLSPEEEKMVDEFASKIDPIHRQYLHMVWEVKKRLRTFRKTHLRE